MNVIIISQCSKNALRETRRILDQFAERRGDRTWQTAITLQGLNTLHKLLRGTARKNTAVACHWLRGRNRSELLWIVGDTSRFNAQGAAPTNTTNRDLLRSRDENDWHTLQLISLLSLLAALFHDIGKACLAFQNKLKSKRPLSDAFRHEWVSLRIFQAFVGQSTDEEWLTRLRNYQEEDDSWIKNLFKDGIDRSRIQSPFAGMPPLAQAVGWLIVSHHRLPTQGRDVPIHSSALQHLPESIEDQWCGSLPDADEKAVSACWTFKKGLSFDSSSWRKQASKTAVRFLDRQHPPITGLMDNHYVLAISRMALMLSDHYYSSQLTQSRYGDPGHALFANTQRASGELNQRLDEHLIGVSVNAKRIVGTLPHLEQKLPRIARHKGFRQRSRDKRFHWQDKAFDLADGVRNRTFQQGFFGVNMASTGCGKTLANGRILYALSDPQLGARFSMALGLRSLTLQTGDVYREKLGLGSEDLAVLVGGSAVQRLHEHKKSLESNSEPTNETSLELLSEHQYVHFEGSIEDGPLNRWLSQNPDVRKLLNAPVLVCTIDHLMPAVESTRGGHQIAPMLRLMTSDLVLDEPDDFGPEDLPALARLVHHAGLLGGRLLLSSATLPPSMVQGLFQAYLEGRRIYQSNRGIPGQPVNVCCAWFDEFSAQSSDHGCLESFQESHKTFVENRLGKLAKAEVRRRAEIQDVPISHGQTYDLVCSELAELLHRHIHTLHERHHDTDPKTCKRISFGLVRMANITPLVDTARHLCQLGAKEGVHIHLCVYHSQHPLLIRSGIERHLDRLLLRKDPAVIFRQEDIRRQLDVAPEQDHIYVVMATAVAEVGRDHDYDWGIVEPSSMRSIIQLAGRIRRHRPGPCTSPNLLLLNANFRHILNGEGAIAFCGPGFENRSFPLETHHLTELLTPEQLERIDSSSRIRERTNPQPRNNLADIEHEHLRALMLGSSEGDRLKIKPVSWWWTTRAPLSGELQRKQPFRFDPLGRQMYALLPDEDGLPRFHRFEEEGAPTSVHGNLLHPLSVERGPRLSFWGEPDYLEALENLADALQMETRDCAYRFGAVDLPAKEAKQGWHYHPALGFSRYC